MQDLERLVFWSGGRKVPLLAVGILRAGVL